MYNINKNKGFLLDIGAGKIRRENFVTLDKKKLPGIDIVHDLEVFPYPLPDECCLTIIASHILEHIKPWLFIEVMDELWRVMKVGGNLAITTPYAGSIGYWQDPTHCNGITEGTWMYFDSKYPFYEVYKPKPWKVMKGFPIWQVIGNLECVLEKVKDGDT